MIRRASAAAERDIREIARRIAADNPRAADAWLDRLEELFAAVSAMPGMGKSLNELSPDLRSFPHGDYLILYRPGRSGVFVLRVLHGSRDWRRLV